MWIYSNDSCLHLIPFLYHQGLLFLIDAWSLYIFWHSNLVHIYDIPPVNIFDGTNGPCTYYPFPSPCTYYPHIYPLYIQYPHDFKESAKHFSGVKNYQRRIIISSYCIISVGASKRNFSAAKCPRTKKNSAMSSHTFLDVSHSLHWRVLRHTHVYLSLCPHSGHVLFLIVPSTDIDTSSLVHPSYPSLE